MPIYETIFIVSPDYTDEQKTEVITRMRDVLKKGGAEIKVTEDWGVKKLAYRVAKQLRGHYYYYCYGSKPESVRELERNLKITESVLKYMTVKLGKKEIERLELRLQEKGISDDVIKREDMSEPDVEPIEEKAIDLEAEETEAEETEAEEEAEAIPEQPDNAGQETQAEETTSATTEETKEEEHKL